MTDAEEGRFVAEIFEQKQNQMNNGDFAILYRTNAQSHEIEKRDIPYRIYGGLSFTKEKKKRCVVLFVIKLIQKRRRSIDARD
jgi:DNA helicase-2/ATP-dependent DNA helicase PcrA